MYGSWWNGGGTSSWWCSGGTSSQRRSLVAGPQQWNLVAVAHDRRWESQGGVSMGGGAQNPSRDGTLVPIVNVAYK
jgi:hypothetical protein